MIRPTDRRAFLKTSFAAGSSLLLTGTRASGAINGANDRLRVAVAGVNGQGMGHIRAWHRQENVEVAYLADPHQGALSKAMQRLQELSGGLTKCQAIGDIRQALEDPSIDAISIATPHHWHALMTIWAAQAGKHVYVEKPMSHDIAEGRSVIRAQQETGIVLQHGTQRRSDAGIAGLHEALRKGTLPRLKTAYAYCCKPRVGIGHQPSVTPPSELDWNLWRGPAVLHHYHANLVPYNWHWFWPTGNGDLNNQGTHQLDVACWSIDADQTFPVRAMAIGGRFKWNDQGETPNTMFGIAEYSNGQQVLINVRNLDYEGYERQVFNEYYLEDGSKIIGETQYKIIRPGSQEAEPLDLENGSVTPGGAFGSFTAAVRANDPTMVNGNAEEAHRSCVLGHILNNSYRLGKKVPFTAKAAKFGDNTDAAEHFAKLHEIMRDGVGIPEDGEEYIVGPWLSFDAKTERFIGDHADQANGLLKDPANPGFDIPQEYRM